MSVKGARNTATRNAPPGSLSMTDSNTMMMRIGTICPVPINQLTDRAGPEGMGDCWDVWVARVQQFRGFTKGSVVAPWKSPPPTGCCNNNICRDVRTSGVPASTSPRTSPFHDPTANSAATSSILQPISCYQHQLSYTIATSVSGFTVCVELDRRSFSSCCRAGPGCGGDMLLFGRSGQA